MKERYFSPQFKKNVKCEKFYANVIKFFYSRVADVPADIPNRGKYLNPIPDDFVTENQKKVTTKKMGFFKLDIVNLHRIYLQNWIFEKNIVFWK